MPHLQLKDVPATLDWRDSGMVSPVKDQKTCGASWAYATASAVESRRKFIAGEMLDISV